MARFAGGRVLAAVVVVVSTCGLPTVGPLDVFAGARSLKRATLEEFEQARQGDVRALQRIAVHPELVAEFTGLSESAVRTIIADIYFRESAQPESPIVSASGDEGSSSFRPRTLPRLADYDPRVWARLMPHRRYTADIADRLALDYLLEEERLGIAGSAP